MPKNQTARNKKKKKIKLNHQKQVENKTNIFQIIKKKKAIKKFEFRFNRNF